MHKLLPLLLAACGSTVPARIELVDGRLVELATTGTGDSTVVFEAGLGEDWTSFDQVASELASHARVFAYSRPGYGASDPAITPRDPATIVEELRALLAHENYAPPYVLVGHSIGGGYMELFAKAHADEVAGVVLIDPRHRDFLATCEAAALDDCGITESQLRTLGPSTVDEYRGYVLAPDQIGAAGSFGSYPVRVLTATDHPTSSGWEQLWEGMLGELAAEAADGQQIIVRGAGHHIQLDRPEVVVDTIVSVLPGGAL